MVKNTDKKFQTNFANFFFRYEFINKFYKVIFQKITIIIHNEKYTRNHQM